MDRGSDHVFRWVQIIYVFLRNFSIVYCECWVKGRSSIASWMMDVDAGLVSLLIYVYI